MEFDMHPALMAICSLVALSALGQGNLIPNPSFETAIDFNEISADANWNKCMKDDTPDYFEFDRATLLPESTAELNRLLRFLNRHPDIAILIEGHTDNVGSHTYNMQLSEERASAVVNYLVEHGIPDDRLQFRGYGYTRPVIENITDKNRSLNRRVAFRIIEP